MNNTEERFIEYLNRHNCKPLWNEWKGVLKTHLIECENGHIVNSRPNNVYSGQGHCPKCAIINQGITRKRQSEIKYIDLLLSLGCEPMWDEWQGSSKSHIIKCEYGHIVKPYPYNVKKVGHCDICGRINRARTQSSNGEQKTIQILKLNGAIPLWNEWNGANNPHKIQCKSNHIIYTRPGDICAGQGICHICAGREWDVFYVVHNDSIVKFGITSGNPKNRLNQHRYIGLNVIDIVIINIDARKLETDIIHFLNEHEYKSVKGYEYFDIECLPIIITEINKYNLENTAFNND